MRARRIISRVVLGAALGAATTIGIAWGVAIHGIDKTGITPPTIADAHAIPEGTKAFVCFAPERRSMWTVIESGHWELRTDTGESVQVDEPRVGWTIQTRTVRKAIEGVDGRRLVPWETRVEVQFGWPLRALWGAAGRSGSSNGQWVKRQSALTLSSSSALDHPFITSGPAGASARSLAVPTGLLPWGFAADAVILGTAWILVFIAAARVRLLVREHRRRRLRLCSCCSYPRTGLPPGALCPECGTASNP